MNFYEWLENLKVGDKVIVVNSLSYSLDRIDTIKRLTKTMIILKNSDYRFSRKDSHATGGCDYHVPWLEEATPERLSILREKIHRSNLIYRLGEIQWSNIKTDKLSEIYEQVELITTDPDCLIRVKVE